MPLKNGKTVAVERRVDLASLFCMIGRHGPAVALAVIALLSVLAGVIIYRTVRRKRRKATAEAADGENKSTGAETDASATRPSPGEPHGSVESTDMSNEVKEDVDLIQSNFKIRHRRAAAEKMPPHYSSLESDIPVHTTSGETDKETAVVWDPYKVAATYAKEANRSLQRDTDTLAEMVEEPVDCHRGATDDIFEDVIEEIHDNYSCLKGPDSSIHENHEDEKDDNKTQGSHCIRPRNSPAQTKVLKAECQEDVTTDKDVSEKNRRREENFQCALNSPVSFEPTSHMGEKGNDDRAHDNKTILETNGMESNFKEPVTYIEKAHVLDIGYGEDEEFEDENPDSTEDNRLSPDKENKNEGEESKEECGRSDITTDAKAQISACNDFLELSLGCQQSQKEEKIALSLDEDSDSTIVGPQTPSHETANLPENHANCNTMVLAKECNDHVYDPHVESCYQQSVQMIRNEVFDKASLAAAPGIVAYDSENSTTPIMAEEISLPHSATDAAAYGNATITSSIMSKEISHPNMLSCSQDQLSDQTKNMTKDNSPPMCPIHLASLEQHVLWNNDISPSGVGEESGISSMAVSPDLQDAGNGFDVTVENMVLPMMRCDLQSEVQTAAQNSLFAVINEGMVVGPHLSSRSRPRHSEYKDLTNYESFAANEDMFGHEIEDRYHRAMDQFTAEITTGVTSSSELKTLTDMKDVFEVLEVKENNAGVSVGKKEDTKAKEEKEEGYEKTEISIMEATMDNNEWITDSSYQVLPWMNLSAPSSAQDHTKTNQLPNEECQRSSVVTDTSCTPATDVLPTIEQTSTLSLVDKNTENNKRFVAIVPQNINVTFRIHYVTQSPYQTVAVTGNQQELGNWKRFIPLERGKDGHWAKVISLPSESHVEWKFVLVDKGEVCRWEECGNRLLDTGYGDDLLVHKWWGLL